MIRLALLIVLVFVVLHLLGGRHDVGFLSGAQPAADLGLLSGLLYAASWFAAVIVAPVVGIASVFAALLHPSVECGKMAARVRTWIDSRRR